MWHTLAACNACGKQQHVNEDEKKTQKEMKNAGIVVKFSQLSKKKMGRKAAKINDSQKIG